MSWSLPLGGLAWEVPDWGAADEEARLLGQPHPPIPYLRLDSVLALTPEVCAAWACRWRQWLPAPTPTVAAYLLIRHIHMLPRREQKKGTNPNPYCEARRGWGWGLTLTQRNWNTPQAYTHGQTQDDTCARPRAQGSPPGHSPVS